MVSSPPSARSLFTRRQFFKVSVCAVFGLGFYGCVIDRHWLQIVHSDVYLEGLPHQFEGYRIAQLSDIHIDEFTEPFFVREAVDRINALTPDAVFLTGDFVSHQLESEKFAEGSAWQCANILTGLQCHNRYAILGNHDAMVGEDLVATALRDNGIPVLRNSFLPIERDGARVWLAGLDDALFGSPDPDKAIPAAIRNRPNEPVILLCHEPDYVDTVLRRPAGQAVDFILSGHTHGGQVRIPFVKPFHLPPLGRKYVHGWFNFGKAQLYVNRGLGTVGIPVRFDCPPEITLFTLRRPVAAVNKT